MIDDQSEPGSWKDALQWRQELDHALWRGPQFGASKKKEYIDMSATTSAINASIDSIFKERGKRYGDFIDHAAISQHLKQSMACPGWHELSCDQKEALEMIVHKIARILNGDPNYADSWVDIAGYAKLVADRLERGQNAVGLALNAGWDFELLENEIRTLADDDFNLTLLGFDDSELKKMLADVEAVELPQLADGDREPFQQMTFTLHDDQAEQVKAAMDAAKAMGPFDSPNENSNGNALARVAETFLTVAGNGNG